MRQEAGARARIQNVRVRTNLSQAVTIRKEQKETEKTEMFRGARRGFQDKTAGHCSVRVPKSQLGRFEPMFLALFSLFSPVQLQCYG
jgi:hypothetical protein